MSAVWTHFGVMMMTEVEWTANYTMLNYQDCQQIASKMCRPTGTLHTTFYSLSLASGSGPVSQLPCQPLAKSLKV